MSYAPGDAPIIIITNAPDAYDYGATVIDSTPMSGYFNGRPNGSPFRAVRLIPDDGGYYAQYQQDRYRSGSYLVLTPAAWSQWITDGLIILPEQEEQERAG